MLKGYLRAAALALGLAASTAPAAALDLGNYDLENLIFLELKTGRVVIELRPDLAPNHVARIRELTRQGFYDGLLFHRTIKGFMVQTGDPLGNGSGGSGRKLGAEFNREPHVPGIVSMARSANPNSADSQFFIMLGASPALDGKYTVWGRVIDGMEHVNRIKLGDARLNGQVENPDRIVSMKVAADVEDGR